MMKKYDAIPSRRLKNKTLPYEYQGKDNFYCRRCGKIRENEIKSKEDPRYCKLCMGETKYDLKQKVIKNAKRKIN